MSQIIPFRYNKYRNWSSSHSPVDYKEKSVEAYLRLLEEVEGMLHDVMSQQIEMLMKYAVHIQFDTSTQTIMIRSHYFSFSAFHKMLQHLVNQGWRMKSSIRGGYQLRHSSYSVDRDNSIEDFFFLSVKRAVRDLAWRDNSFHNEVEALLKYLETKYTS